MTTAICARFAASATREKSLRSASVEGFVCWTVGAGGGGGGMAPKPFVVADCGHCEAVLWACWRVGDDSGRPFLGGMSGIVS